MEITHGTTLATKTTELMAVCEPLQMKCLEDVEALA